MITRLVSRGRRRGALNPVSSGSRARRGATMVEYCFLVVLVAAVAILSVKAMAVGVQKSFVAAEANLAPS